MDKINKLKVNIGPLHGFDYIPIWDPTIGEAERITVNKLKEYITSGVTFNSVSVTGGTYSNGTITFYNSDNTTFDVTGLVSGDTYTTGATYSGGMVYFDTNQQTNAYILDLTTLILSGGSSIVTGFTYNDNNRLTLKQTNYPDLNVYLNTFSGITVNGFINNVSGVRFNTSPSTTHVEGQLHWNNDDKTLNVDTDVNNVAIQVGQENVIRVVNKTGSVINNGSLVFINGAQGNRPTIELADYRTESGSSLTIGMATHNISNNNNGYVTTFGLVRDLNTSSYSEGDLLYLYTGGTFTNIKPIPPNHAVRVGYITTSNVSTGIVLVSVQNGHELDELHDVLISGKTNYDIIQYDSTDDLWKNTNTPIFNSISATTYYGDGSNLTGVSGTDNYTTGVTLNGNVLVFNRTDIYSAYTVDLSTLVVNSSGGTSNILSPTEPSPYTYSASTWVRTTDYESFIYDQVRGKWLGVGVDSFTGSRNQLNQTNLFLRHDDGIPYNVAPFYVPKDSTITSVVTSCFGPHTFKGVIATGTTLPANIIYYLQLTAETSKIDNLVNIDVMSGTTLYLYMSGSTIDYPKMEVFYKNS